MTLDIVTGPVGGLTDGSLDGPDRWPDDADHRQIRRWIVRLLRPGIGSGSGILVGPDLVLTCRHVVQDLFGTDDPRSEAAAAEVVVSLGLGRRPGEGVFTRYLRQSVDGASPLDGASWDALPGSGNGDLDFALLRLDDDLGPDADWLSFQEFQSPERLAAGAAEGVVTFFMYHFPDPADGSPFMEARLSAARLPQDWRLGDGLIAHRVASEKGSSGAMLFATVDGSRPFPIALHRGRLTQGPDKIAVAVSSVLSAVAGSRRPLYQQLTTPPAELRQHRELQRLAEPQVILARNLIDRDVQAKTAVGGTVARSKKVQPIFEASWSEMTLFQARLAEFDLPLRLLPDTSLQQKMRSWTLAGVKGAPPVDRGIPKWGIESLGGETWLRDGPDEAIATICNRMADALALDASVLLTARVEIERTADYRALEALLLALAQALQGPEARADVLVLLWIGDTGLSDRVRQQGRDVLRRLWGGRALQPVVGMPVQLSEVVPADLAPWTEDIVAAFNVRKPDVDQEIRMAWTRLDQRVPRQAVAGRHAFDSVVQALDEPLQSWVYRHFRRLYEAARRPS